MSCTDMLPARSTMIFRLALVDGDRHRLLRTQKTPGGLDRCVREHAGVRQRFPDSAPH